MFSWTPSDSDGGKSHTFEVVVRKDAMLDRETITINVNDVVKDSQATKEPEPEPKQTTPEPLSIPASFVDESKDPQSYVDRYNNEPSYKKWFDDNFSEYDSIYHAIGLDDQTPKKVYGYCGTGTKLIDGVCEIMEMPQQKPWWQFW